MGMKYKSVLVVTYGRSGSTLLQGVLNGIPGCLVRGENYNFIFDLYSAHAKLVAARAKKGEKPSNSWYGAGLLDDELFLRDTTDLIRRLLLADRAGDASVRAYGFKEIRYFQVVDRLEGYLDFLGRVFPEVAFVFLTRDLDEVLQSGWWVFANPWKTKRSLLRFEQKCADYRAGKANCFHVDYRDMVEKTPRFREMFAFLGVDYDPAVVDGILAVRHSYPGGREVPRWRRLLHYYREKWRGVNTDGSAP